MLRILVLHQGSALDLLGCLQHSADPMLISSCLWRKKRPLAFYKLNLEHKNGGMTKCLEKPRRYIRKSKFWIFFLHEIRTHLMHFIGLESKNILLKCYKTFCKLVTVNLKPWNRNGFKSIKLSIDSFSIIWCRHWWEMIIPID